MDEPFDVLTSDLLHRWCDGLLAVQINTPSDFTQHGALACPGCGVIHGRCMDAVYPLLHMAKSTGDETYLTAGIAVFEWAENITLESGAWTNGLDPDSWQGTTLFGAIALAETLHHHGDLLESSRRRRWLTRLGRAAEFIYKTIDRMDYANINYGCTAIYGMHLLGTMLGRADYIERSRQLADELDAYISGPSGLLIGEASPATGTSPRGCRAVDLGYNVEESLPSMAVAARTTGDKKLAATVRRLMVTHLEFMLPDGAWDNSFGTRQAKWTYYGSRTSDGCQLGYALLADEHPAFADAVIENTRLMRDCTPGGLLTGGPHCHSAGIKPCVHHTFTHAKALAAVRDCEGLATRIHRTEPLPRALADGVCSYPEIATWLVARGPWRGTVTAYDWPYRKGVRQPTGGCISMLWHPTVGPILAGSMPRYVRVEPHNMQVNPAPGDYPLTPRVELRQDKAWFTQLYDLAARVHYSDAEERVRFEVVANLLDEMGEAPPNGRAESSLSYIFDEEAVTIMATTPGVGSDSGRPQLVLPIISASTEVVTQVAANRIEIVRRRARIVVEGNAPLRIENTGSPRIFNLVPGFEAVPITAELPNSGKLVCQLKVVATG